ncbi:glycosyltransferase family 4 protein [Niveibacterium terrae]|uniref:glycosyltransferase family 4 protein n=1 Tax=Niveibacterium terrae TaxID=3373598 RepID=UPI003A8DA1B0
MPPKRSHALVVTRNLPPLVGGMERLIWHIVEAIAGTHEVHVVGPEGSAKRLPEGVTASEVPLKPMPLFLLRAAWASLVSALRLRPTFVLAGSGLTAPIVWLAARLSGARAIVYLHGLDVETRHWLYRLLWRPLFRRFDLVIVNSHFTRDLALEAKVPAERIRIIHPGVELPEISKKAEARDAFRSHFGLGEAPLMLYVGRITPRKGLTKFVDDILPRVLNARPDAKLAVIGDEPHGALLKAAHGERSRAEEALANRKISSSVTFLGELAQNDPVLTEAYFSSEVMIFPVQDRPGDNEGFGMVAIEAAAHGLPTVAFAVGGVPDAVSEGISGKLIPSGDNDAFSDAVIGYLVKPNDLKSRPFAEKFSWTEFKIKLDRELKSI